METINAEEVAKCIKIHKQLKTLAKRMWEKKKNVIEEREGVVHSRYVNTTYVLWGPKANIENKRMLSITTLHWCYVYENKKTTNLNKKCFCKNLIVRFCIVQPWLSTGFVNFSFLHIFRQILLHWFQVSIRFFSKPISWKVMASWKS